jgi:hypothetical protein
MSAYVDEMLVEHGAETSWFYVFCMSEAEDNLSQWRAYGEGENGVSIGLDGRRLQPKTQNTTWPAPVSYVGD